MKKINKYWLLLPALLITTMTPFIGVQAQQKADEAVVQEEKGPHNGKLLRQGDFAIELAIVEDGVPPEFRVWGTKDGQPIEPENLEVSVTLDRLGDVQDRVSFFTQEGFLRGNMEIYEPHSFKVTLEASYDAKQYRWQYDNFEGRVVIPDAIAKANAIKTLRAGPAVILNTLRSYGRLIIPEENKRVIGARYPGVIKRVHVNYGGTVSKGDKLFTIESNQGLNAYTIVAPMNGVVSEVMASAGEIASDQALLHLINKQTLLAELFVFPSDIAQLKLGAAVTLNIDGFSKSVPAKVVFIGTELKVGKGFPVRVEVANADGLYSPGLFVQGEITVSQREVQLAVQREAIQAFRDFQVVYAKVDDTYEVRMLQLGAQDSQWIEVLGGLQLGTEYVSENSYVIKADIEKSGASHDH